MAHVTKPPQYFSNVVVKLIRDCCWQCGVMALTDVSLSTESVCYACIRRLRQNFVGTISGRTVDSNARTANKTFVMGSAPYVSLYVRACLSEYIHDEGINNY